MPIQWADFGKKTKDLLTKKYDFKNELKTVNKTSDGVSIETGCCGTTAQGFMKFSCKREFGSIEAEVSSNAEVGDKAKVTLDKLVKHVAVTLNASTDDSLGVEALFEKDSFSGRLAIQSAELKTNASSTATVGVEATFKKDSVAGTLEVNHKETATTAGVSAAFAINKDIVWGVC